MSKNKILQTISAQAEWGKGLFTKEHLNDSFGSKSSFKYFIAKNAFKNDNDFNTEPDVSFP